MEDEATRTRLLAGMLRGKKLGVWRRRLGCRVDSTSSRKCEPTCIAAGFGHHVCSARCTCSPLSIDVQLRA